MRIRILSLASLLLLPVVTRADTAVSPQAGGFLGIWFELGQKSEHGDPRTWRIARWTGGEWLFQPNPTSTSPTAPATRSGGSPTT